MGVDLLGLYGNGAVGGVIGCLDVDTGSPEVVEHQGVGACHARDAAAAAAVAHRAGKGHIRHDVLSCQGVAGLTHARGLLQGGQTLEACLQLVVLSGRLQRRDFRSG